MIVLEKLSFRYPKTENDVLSGLSCTFEAGECVAVTGQNGCGKTTLVRLVCGMLRPTAGRISIDGEDTAKMDLFSVGRRVGCVFQDPSRQLFCTSVEEEVRFGLVNMGLPGNEIDERTARYLKLFRLEHLAGAFPRTLSQGERQRTVLAAVLAMGTRYLLLDEPTSGLDMRAREELGESLAELTRQGCGVIFVSHERPFIERWATREWVMP